MDDEGTDGLAPRRQRTLGAAGWKVADSNHEPEREKFQRERAEHEQLRAEKDQEIARLEAELSWVEAERESARDADEGRRRA